MFDFCWVDEFYWIEVFLVLLVGVWNFGSLFCFCCECLGGVSWELGWRYCGGLGWLRGNMGEWCWSVGCVSCVRMGFWWVSYWFVMGECCWVDYCVKIDFEVF